MEIKDLITDAELIRDIFQETDLVLPEDIKIKCKDCNKEFIFSIGEQEFYKSKNFPFPKRCRRCAKKKRSRFLNYK